MNVSEIWILLSLNPVRLIRWAKKKTQSLILLIAFFNRLVVDMKPSDMKFGYKSWRVWYLLIGQMYLTITPLDLCFTFLRVYNVNLSPTSIIHAPSGSLDYLKLLSGNLPFQRVFVCLSRKDISFRIQPNFPYHVAKPISRFSIFYTVCPPPVHTAANSRRIKLVRLALFAEHME